MDDPTTEEGVPVPIRRQIRRLIRRARGTVAGGWHDLPSITARVVAPIRERAAQARASRRRRR